ncbi:MAG TPA: AMP-binding protein [Candidatus Acidoferrales bacterium]|nr:AMP-binding protein [Candidatus Acidoferrales bacterium]
MSETQGAMPRGSLFDYFRPDTRPVNETAVVWRRGYRRERWSYSTLLSHATKFAIELQARGIVKGDRVLIWGENSGEWIAAFLGCIFRGAIAVPLDAIGEKSFAERVAKQAGVRLAIVGRNLAAENLTQQVITLEDLTQISARRASGNFSAVSAAKDDPVEIVFTSGTTAEPRGVVLTHGNILANIAPIADEFERYRRYERFFHPIRILDLLPLSHVFGQFLGIFLPQVFGATINFIDTLNPAEVIREIRGQHIMVLVAVPRLIESLRSQIERDLEARRKVESFRRAFDRVADAHFLRRWWRFRAIRRRFGWRFLAMVSGGAALPAETEAFWTRLGYAVIQGYGLTETTSLISLNHPFRIGRGSIGKPMPGNEIKLSEEGEILVRGKNVASGYWKEDGVTQSVDSEGWFHTGDLGERDTAGNLYFKGRSKNVIVTPEGMKVYPGDLEAELRKEPAVRDALVIGLEKDGNAEACAVLLLRDGDSSSSEKEAANIVRHANQRLAPFQQMRSWLVWRDQDFPRTPTQKPILSKIRQAAEDEVLGRTPSVSSEKNDLLARLTRGGANTGKDEPLQLSSMERVELMGELENRYQVDLSEADFSKAETASDIERMIQSPSARAPAFQYPTWPQSWPVRIFRAAAYNCLAVPAMLVLGWPRITGHEKLASLPTGAKKANLIIANHVTYFDPAYIMLGLPERFRSKLAVAMDGELLESMRTPPPGRNAFLAIVDRITYFLLVSIFDVFPLPRYAGFQRSFAFMGNLIDQGWNVLIFPEGERTKTGRLSAFRTGIGLLATQLRVPVIPMYLGSFGELKQQGKHIARPRQVSVAIGQPISFAETDDPANIAQELQRRVESLGKQVRE